MGVLTGGGIVGVLTGGEVVGVLTGGGTMSVWTGGWKCGCKIPPILPWVLSVFVAPVGPLSHDPRYKSLEVLYPHLLH